MRLMGLDFSIRTDKGKRKVNEDYALCVRRKDGICLFIVADGLGGHGRGDEASRFVTEFFRDSFITAKEVDEGFLSKTFREAQAALIEKKNQSEDPELAQLTTAAVLLIDDECYQYGWSGDSRVYVFEDRKAVLRTADHSVPQLLFESGEIGEDEIRKHPDRNKIISAFGIRSEDFVYTVSPVEKYSEKNDFLLCTDGLWEYVLEEEMEKELEKTDKAAKWLDRLFDCVQKQEFSNILDNYTAIAVRNKKK